ncbi:hypothetical protein J8273_2134 [Carpediemonas membranifera]|uniref:Uncharacterized protein n=1 Tax=Carpediemonas membranifera TaxID=201153 RepID=A0A8J6AX83_9EUKA|nr:hypothetical protein J8273_2134 [Carpediemonas membranifera]|eukprot:KAG9396403.1 hypothetical protein J8273_2134 [Carpediemonas membranifera]
MEHENARTPSFLTRLIHIIYGPSRKEFHQYQLAYTMAILETNGTPGNVPALLAAAFLHQYGKRISSIPRSLVCPEDISYNDLVSQLEALPPPTNKAAAIFLKRAMDILTDGPELTIQQTSLSHANGPHSIVSLSPALFWAVMMAAGADPDLEHKEERMFPLFELTGLDERPDVIDGYSPHARACWFLCKKLFFARFNSEVDGTHIQSGSNLYPLHFLLYEGRLFSWGPVQWSGNKVDATSTLDAELVVRRYHRVQLPAPIIRFHTVGSDSVAVTAAGLFAWGERIQDLTGPTRVQFSDHIAQAESDLAHWSKHELFDSIDSVRLHTGSTTMLFFTARVTGQTTHCLGQLSPKFQPIPLPCDHFDKVLSNAGIALIKDRRAFMVGKNWCGRLGVGHQYPVDVFTELPFPVDDVALLNEYSVFVSGQKLLYGGVGTVPSFEFGKLENGRMVLHPTKLSLPCSIKRAFIDPNCWCFVRSDDTGSFGYYSKFDGGVWEVDREVIWAIRGRGSTTWLGAEGGCYLLKDGTVSARASDSTDSGSDSDSDSGVESEVSFVEVELESEVEAVDEPVWFDDVDGSCAEFYRRLKTGIVVDGIELTEICGFDI